MNQHYHKSPVILITGSSGVGKDTILSKLVATYPRLSAVTSVTTRWPPRDQEKFLNDYYFIDDLRFDWLLSTDQLMESTEIYGHRYGTLRAELERVHQAHKIPIIEVDPAGTTHYQNSDYDAHIVYLDFPNAEEQKQRLLGREPNMNPEELDIRLAKAAEQRAWAAEQATAGNLKIVINDKIGACLSSIVENLDLDLK